MEITERTINNIVEESSPTHSTKRTIITSLLGIGCFLVILAIGITGGYLYSSYYSKQNTVVLNKDTSITSTTLPTVDSTLIFKKFDSNTPNSPNSVSITDSSGKVLSSFRAQDTDSTYETAFTNGNNYISFSSGLVSSNEFPVGTGVAETKYSVFESTGKIDNIAPNITGLFNTDGTHAVIQPFVINNTYLLGFNTSNTRDFNITNLITGKSQILFTVSPIGSTLTNNAIFLPQDISPDGSNISFIVDDEKVGTYNITKPSIIRYNILQGSYAIHIIPSSITANGLGSLTESGNFHASWDGDFLTYPTISQGSQGEIETLHLYSFTQQKDYVLPLQNTQPVGGGHNIFFSPDNKYVLATTWSEPYTLYETQTGKVIKMFNGFGDPQYNLFQMVGWINDTTLAGTISTTTTANDWTTGPSSSFSYNITSDTIQNFPSTLGGLTAILIKSSTQSKLTVPTAIDTSTPTPSVAITPSEANIPSVDESSWKTYTSTNNNATFKYPSDWTPVTPSIQSNLSINTDQIALKSPSGAIQINWVTELSGFGGACDPNVSPDQGGCALVTIISKNPIPNASGLFIVAGTITHDQKIYQPFLAVQDTEGLTTSQRTMGYDMFSINNTNGGSLFSTSGAYAGGPSLSQQDASAYFNKPEVQTAEEIFMSLTFQK